MATITHNLSPIGFGAFKIGRSRGAKYPGVYDVPDAAVASRLLNGVLDLGITYIDTAPAYGLSEERIGEAIAHRKTEFFLSTKVGETFRDGVSAHDFSGNAVRASVDASRKRLRMERLDLVFVHASRDDVRVIHETDVVSTLCALRDEGVIGAVGFSGYSEPAFRAALGWADAVMVEYHSRDRSLASVLEEAAGRGVTVIVKKALASGRLSPENALPFVLGHKAVTSVVVGSLNLDHLRENLRLGCETRSSVRPSASPGGSNEVA